MNTKKLVTLGILSALAVIIIMTTRFPLFMNFYIYEAGDIPILIAGLVYGPIAGLIVSVLASGIQAFTFDQAGGPIGFLMHVIASGTLVLVSSLIFKYLKKKHFSELKGLIIALASGTIAMTLIMILANIIFVPLFWHAPLSYVMPILLPATLPFNLIKAGANSIVTFIIFLSLRKYITGFLR